MGCLVNTLSTFCQHIRDTQESVSAMATERQASSVANDLLLLLLLRLEVIAGKHREIFLDSFVIG